MHIQKVYIFTDIFIVTIPSRRRIFIFLLDSHIFLASEYHPPARSRDPVLPAVREPRGVVAQPSCSCVQAARVKTK